MAKDIKSMSDQELSAFMGGSPGNDLESMLADGRASISGPDLHFIRQRQAAGANDAASPFYTPLRFIDDQRMFGGHGRLG